MPPAIPPSLPVPAPSRTVAGSSHASALEDLAPFAVGALLTGSSAWHLLHLAGAIASPGPLNGTPLPTSLLLAGAGAAVALGAWERRSLKRRAVQADDAARRAMAQRDLAMLQARRMRAQAEGLALMREIHRSTAIPQRAERLHRILTLLGDMFEARETALFALSGTGTSIRPLPAAILRSTNKEDLFVDFDPETGEPPAPDGALRIKKDSAAIQRDGSQLTVSGTLERAGQAVARARWRPGAQGDPDILSRFDAPDILEHALAKIDLGPAARALAIKAVESRRTVRLELGVADGAEELLLCVPLLADQRPLGVLRIRRSADGFRGAESAGIEELLVESAKHIALALKKDEDDRKAITDVLTGLYIKRHFLVTLEQLRATATADGTPFCLVLGDIDHFKKVNDTHGHLSGDLVLKGVSGVLRRSLRGGDMAFRYGGEELALLLPDTRVEAAEQTAERIRAAVQASAFKGEKGQPVPVTISLGIAQYEPGMTGEALVGRTDRALYASKKGGRNRATRWSATLPDPLAAAPVPASSSTRAFSGKM